MWVSSTVMPGRIIETARRIEAGGWDGLAFGDTQNLWAETFTSLGMAAAATRSLGLAAVGVNPVTRKSAVVASSVGTLRAESDRTIVLGVSRGDSSLASVGLARPTVDQCVDYLRELNLYLSGGSPGPTLDSIRWVDHLALPRIPVEVVTSGARMVEAVAPHCDGLILAVGADPRRIRTLTQVAEEARAKAGVDTPFRISAFVHVSTHPDADEARRIIRGSVALYARFSVSSAASTAPGLTPGDVDAVNQAVRSYDRGDHGSSASSSAASLSDEFLDRFAILGSPAYCAERLGTVIDAGLSRVIVVASGRSLSNYEETATAEMRLAEDVLSRLTPFIGRPRRDR